ncbi:protein kinase domain-containing protein [Saccharothrix hoggarensis]
MSPSTSSDHLLADRYRLLEPIGLGGMAEVRRAWDTTLCRHVAVKLFQPGFDEAAARRFDNEVRTLACLSHPGLVSVYDADTQAETPFVVLQLVEGQTLRELIDLGPLSLDRTRRLGAALADALAYVHAHDLVHRDVKPSNILLDAEGNAYLADFGLVHLTGATRMTRTDQLVGTAAYLAPEQVLGGDVDHPADVYALGLVLLECLTGRREYTGGDVEAAVARLHRTPAVPDDLPSEVAGLLSRMTASAPEERPTAEECTRVLSVLDDVPEQRKPDGSVKPVALVKPPDEPTLKLARGSRSSWKTLVASAGVLVGAFAITMAATSEEQPATSAPPASSTQQASVEQPGSSPAPQNPVQPQYLGTPQTPDAAQATATPQVTTSVEPTAAAPAGDAGAGDTGAGDTAAPVTGPNTRTTTEAVTPTTTPAAPTSEPVVPTPEPSETNPEPEEPPTAPTEESN